MPKLTARRFDNFKLDLRPLAAHRRYLDLTQGQLAAAADVHRVTVTNTELNKREPTLREMVAWTRALGVPLTDLFTVQDPT
jgi:DNA-binding XRE family transcriptional regulator